MSEEMTRDQAIEQMGRYKAECVQLSRERDEAVAVATIAHAEAENVSATCRASELLRNSEVATVKATATASIKDAQDAAAQAVCENIKTCSDRVAASEAKATAESQRAAGYRLALTNALRLLGDYSATITKALEQ